MTIKHEATIVENNVQNYVTPDRIVLEFSEDFPNALIQCQHILENPSVDIVSVELGNPSQHLLEFTCFDADGNEFEPDSTNSYDFWMDSITVHATNPTLISVMFCTDLPGTQNFWVKFPYTALK